MVKAGSCVRSSQNCIDVVDNVPFSRGGVFLSSSSSPLLRAFRACSMDVVCPFGTRVAGSTEVELGIAGSI
jgi:hypothetical protein